MKSLASLLAAARQALFPEPEIDPGRLAVRPAVMADLDRVLFLNSEYAGEQARTWGGSEGGLMKTRGQIREALSDKRSLVLAGTVDGEVVGYALGVRFDADLRPCLWIESIHVSARFRRSALLHMLCKEAVDRLPQTGATSLHTRVRLRDEMTRTALESAGLEETYQVLRTPVFRRGQRM